jgi:hypothetical protein
MSRLFFPGRLLMDGEVAPFVRLVIAVFGLIVGVAGTMAILV